MMFAALSGMSFLSGLMVGIGFTMSAMTLLHTITDERRRRADRELRELERKEGDYYRTVVNRLKVSRGLAETRLATVRDPKMRERAETRLAFIEEMLKP